MDNGMVMTWSKMTDIGHTSIYAFTLVAKLFTPRVNPNITCLNDLLTTQNNVQFAKLDIKATDNQEVEQFMVGEIRYYKSPLWITIDSIKNNKCIDLPIGPLHKLI